MVHHCHVPLGRLLSQRLCALRARAPGFVFPSQRLRSSCSRNFRVDRSIDATPANFLPHVFPLHSPFSVRPSLSRVASVDRSRLLSQRQAVGPNQRRGHGVRIKCRGHNIWRGLRASLRGNYSSIPGWHSSFAGRCVWLGINY
jgi:hypothetical protein